MDRNLAVKNLYRVLQRVRNINGIFATPHENHEFVKIKSVWLFGSVAKGSEQPNDIDIFVELLDYKPDCSVRQNQVESHARKHKLKCRRKLKNSNKVRLHGGFKVNKKSTAYIQLDIHNPVDCVESLAHYLHLRIPSASIHFVHDDLIFDRLDTKQMLYPRCDFDFDAENALTDKFKKKYKKVRVLP